MKLLSFKIPQNFAHSIWVNFLRTGKMVKMWHFLFFLEHCCVYVLVLAHLEPELELEVDDIGDDRDDDF